MAVFRIEKTRDYTVMSNHHLRNTALSLKAKGLLSLMLSLPEGWDYTTKGLAHICKDGVDSICAGVRELEEHGYVVRERVRNSNGQLGAVEYTILEQPRPTEPEREKPKLENPVLDLPVLEKPEQENTVQLNKDILSKEKSNTDISNPIRSNPHAPIGARIGTDGMGWKAEQPLSGKRPTQLQRRYRQEAKEQQQTQEKPAEQSNDTFTIYQLKGGDEMRDYRFEPYDRLLAAGLTVDPANYEAVYTAPITPDMSLEDIYTRFNVDHPKDFTGHSLSVSDVVVLHQDGQDTAHYVDSLPFCV